MQRTITTLRDQAEARGIKVRGQQLRISMEQSAARRERWNRYQAALQALQSAGIDQTKILQCTKATIIYNKTTCEPLGSWVADRWQWNSAACGRLGWINMDIEGAEDAQVRE